MIQVPWSDQSNNACGPCAGLPLLTGEALTQVSRLKITRESQQKECLPKDSHLEAVCSFLELSLALGDRGRALALCLSSNNCISHCSPLLPSLLPEHRDATSPPPSPPAIKTLSACNYITNSRQSRW